MSKKKFNPKQGRSQEERFWEKVDIRSADECWEWQAGTDKKGYGLFIYNGHTSHTNRIAWILANGNIDNPALLVCHTCDNPPCCNPKHLFLGTNQDNMTDMLSKNRHRAIKRFGMKNPMTKISDDAVRELRTLYMTGKYTYNMLAIRFDLSYAHVKDIVRGRRRTNVW